MDEEEFEEIVKINDEDSDEHMFIWKIIYI